MRDRCRAPRTVMRDRGHDAVEHADAQAQRGPAMFVHAQGPATARSRSRECPTSRNTPCLRRADVPASGRRRPPMSPRGGRTSTHHARAPAPASARGGCQRVEQRGQVIAVAHVTSVRRRPARSPIAPVKGADSAEPYGEEPEVQPGDECAATQIADAERDSRKQLKRREENRERETAHQQKARREYRGRTTSWAEYRR